MRPLQHPRPSPPADAGIRLPCSGPCDVGTYGRRNRQILKFSKMKFFFKRLLHTFHIHFVPSALSCALPAF
ncbi:unnamed protein product [Staurois parvus]|uniref:Uncharacterized protein n=1 Tax=Staurois parvus TaxID=386267 RepID=A0ABN9ACW4_9NEOB|nr:unnamed protein product [Staurois parvus]